MYESFHWNFFFIFLPSRSYQTSFEELVETWYRCNLWLVYSRWQIHTSNFIFESSKCFQLLDFTCVQSNVCKERFWKQKTSLFDLDTLLIFTNLRTDPWAVPSCKSVSLVFAAFDVHDTKGTRLLSLWLVVLTQNQNRRITSNVKQNQVSARNVCDFKTQLFSEVWQ